MLKCGGVYDCFGQSNELNCTTINRQIYNTTIDDAVHPDRLCKTTGICLCDNAPKGFVCSCPLHLFLQSNGLYCSSKHACEHWSTCSQIFEKVGKRYKCKCRNMINFHVKWLYASCNIQ